MTGMDVLRDRFLALTGRTAVEETEKVEQCLTMAHGLVDAYCRGRHRRGGVLRPGVEDVILMVAARIAANPEQVQVREQVGPYSLFLAEGFSGFTLVELAVLNRYRKRGI